MRQKSDLLILGASGFIGSALARHAQSLGFGYSCLRHRKRLPADLHPETVYLNSLLTFPWRRLESGPPRMIFHFARIPGSGPLGRSLAARMSAFANRRLLKWMERQPDPPLLILAAGTLAYGAGAEDAVMEDHPLQPTGFARHYAVGEQPIVAAMAASSLPIQIVRPAWVYGARSWLSGFYLLPMKMKGTVPLYGDGSNWMSLIHVEDAAGLMWHIARHGAQRQTYNLIGGEPVRQLQLVEALESVSGLRRQSVRQKEMPFSDPAIWESLTFSQRTASKHLALYQGYPYRHPRLQESLQAIWAHFS